MNIPKMVQNDKIQCYITIYEKNVNIDGQQTKILDNEQFNCFFNTSNDTAFSYENIQTVTNGTVLINGDVIPDELEYFGGIVEIYGIKHNIISIQKYRNAFSPDIVDYTLINVE